MSLGHNVIGTPAAESQSAHTGWQNFWTPQVLRLHKSQRPIRFRQASEVLLFQRTKLHRPRFCRVAITYQTRLHLFFKRQTGQLVDSMVIRNPPRSTLAAAYASARVKIGPKISQHLHRIYHPCSPPAGKKPVLALLCIGFAAQTQLDADGGSGHISRLVNLAVNVLREKDGLRSDYLWRSR